MSTNVWKEPATLESLAKRVDVIETRLGANNPSSILRMGTGANNQVRFKIDGVVKAPSGPITGASLYALAGNPAQLVNRDGHVLANDTQPVSVAMDEEFVTRHSLVNEEKLNPEHVIPLGEQKEVIEPEHGQVVKTVPTEDHSTK